MRFGQFASAHGPPWERVEACSGKWNSTAAPDPVLVKLVALAMSARKSLGSGEVDPLTSHYSKRHLWQLLRISFLAPDIITAIMDGQQPPSLTGRRLLRVTDLPLDWAGQRRVLGFNYIRTASASGGCESGHQRPGPLPTDIPGAEIVSRRRTGERRLYKSRRSRGNFRGIGASNGAKLRSSEEGGAAR